MKKSELRQIIKEVISEKYGDDEHKAYIANWAKRMLSILKTHKILGQPLTNAKLELHDDFAIVTARFTYDEIVMDIHIQFQDNTYDENKPKWTATVALVGVTPKKGSFSKKLTGRNAEPGKVTRLLDAIFNGKFARR